MKYLLRLFSCVVTCTLGMVLADYIDNTYVNSTIWVFFLGAVVADVNTGIRDIIYRKV